MAIIRKWCIMAKSREISLTFFEELNKLTHKYGISFSNGYDNDGQLIFYTGLQCVDYGEGYVFGTIPTDDEEGLPDTERNA